MKEIARRGWHRFRRHVAALWESRGGGFYGFVAVLTFLYLEAIDLAGDLAGIRPAAVDLGWVISFLVSNLVEAVMNTIRSVVWPLSWISHFGIGLLSAGLLAGAYVSYRAIRPGVLRLLRDPEDGPAPIEAASRQQR